jgi:CheY-like chemotaxis protein
MIAKAHKASRSLIYVIDDLLNLTKAEDGQVFTPLDTFDLGATGKQPNRPLLINVLTMSVSEVISTFRKESMRKGLDLTVSTHPGLPRIVKGDPARLRQVISNVVSNAFQHSVSGGIKVDIKPLQVKEDRSVISITVQDVGVGMSEQQLDDLFQEFEQILDEEDREIAVETPKGVEDKEALGLGLAVVARYVRNMNGQIRVKSELGKGTMFSIELPFEHAPGTPISGANLSRRSSFFPISPDNLSPASATSDPDGGERYSSSATDISTPGDGSSAQYQTINEIVPSGALALGTTFPSLGSMPTHSIAMTIQQKRAAGHAAQIQPPIHSATLDLGSSGSIPGTQSTYPFPNMESYDPEEPRRPLKILIAEDNPINAKMLQRRLDKSGHEVHVTVDGQSCYDTYHQVMSALNSNEPKFDAILMDLQMPLVDGHASTRMIRQYEREQAATPPARRTRIPIFAVSASLTETSRFDYVEDGFDAWVLKPIDYGRLEMLLLGINVPDFRRRAVYRLGIWEHGGWFMH